MTVPKFSVQGTIMLVVQAAVVIAGGYFVVALAQAVKATLKPLSAVLGG